MDDSPLALLLAPPLGWALAALWGALWGSFGNVVVHRLGSAAVADESDTFLPAAAAGLRSLRALASPPSSCPVCGARIRWYDNLPVVGWLILRGRCRDCAAPIAIRYPLVEALSSLLAVAVYWRFVIAEPSSPLLQLERFFIYYAFAGTLLVLTLIDLETMLLPFSITLPSLPGFFLAGRLLPDVTLVDALLGLAVGFGALFLLRHGYRWLRHREGLGGGDELLVGMIGGLLGWRALPMTFFGGAMIGTLVTLPILIVRRRSRTKAAAATEELGQVEIPFGPFLAAGGALYLFFGKAIWLAMERYLAGE